MLGFIAYIVNNALSKKAIFPKKQDRYDITEIYVGVAEEVCGANGKPPHLPQKYESCIKDLSLAEGKRSPNWVKMKIPDLDWILDNYRPSFGGTLRDTNKRVWSKIYKEMKTTIIGFDIPAKYYKVNDYDWDFYKLIFNGGRSIATCIDRKCNNYTDVYEADGRGYPLFSEKPVKENTKKPVFMFANPINRPYSITLRTGVFLTKALQTKSINTLYSINLISQNFIYSLIFMGLFLLGLWKSLVWNKFLDYSAYLFFIVSLVLLSIMNDWSFFPNEIPLSAIINLKGIFWLNCLCAMTFFALTTARWKNISIFRHYFLPVIVLSGGWLLTPVQIGISHKLQFLIAITGVGIFATPTCICFYSSFKISKELKSLQVFEYATIEALLKRRSQQVFFGLSFIAFGYNHLLNSWLHFQAVRPTTASSFTVGSVAACIAILAVLFHPNLAKLKKSLYSKYPLTEMARLKLLLNPTELLNWASQKREGIFVEVDLAGSSLLTASIKDKMHLIIRGLRRVVTEDIVSQGFGLIDIKMMGDGIIFILNRKHPDIPSDLNEVSHLLRVRASAYENYIKQAYQIFERDYDDEITAKISLHINIYAVKHYSFNEVDQNQRIQYQHLLGQHISPDKISDKERSMDLDFISEEMNHLMKLIPKAKIGQITIAGSRDYLDHLINDNEVKSLEALAEGKDQGIKQSIEDLGLCYTLKDWQVEGEHQREKERKKTA